MRLQCLLSLGAVSILAGRTVAQVSPTLPRARTYDVIMGERGLENLIRLRDLDQNGDYSGVGESVTYFASNSIASPTPSGIALSGMTGVTCANDGTVYAVDSTADQIVQMRDLNDDGDANDAGEAVVWFSSAGNASGVALGSAQSIAVDSLGRIFVLTANQGTGLVGLDGILKIEDLNVDGDAQDAGEASYYYIVPNASGSLGHSNPFEFAIGPDGCIYYADIGTGGPITRGVYKVQDLNSDNDALDPGEGVLWWVPPVTASAASWFSMAFDHNGYLYVGNQSNLDRSIYRAFDANGSNSITASEQQLYWSSTANITLWDLALREDGTFLSLDGIANQVLAWRDLNADNDFLDGGEVLTVFDCASSGFPSADPRAIAFMRSPELAMTSPAAIGTSVSWLVQTAEPFDIAVACAALSFVPPISLPSFGYLEIDPSTLILFGLTISDVAGQATYTLPLANDPSLIGSYGAQALCGDLYRLYLSNPASFVLQ